MTKTETASRSEPPASGLPVSVALQSIDWHAAHLAVGAAVQAARERGVCINVAVVDAGGVLAAFLRMPGAPLHSVDIAIDKAYTAVSFGLATSQWQAALQQHSAAVREGLVLRPRFVAFGGGLPLMENGQRIGGIGVSGGSEEQDEACAQAGLAAIGLSS
ncbi:MAG: heme-binding protein [Rhodoferax sp.]|uniref:GlcG/HbpS family heme-binding protein n=1 Tax=Rhodoferax sp. TaxID=50421 RepID=UPI002715F005|nr:heme-binding protein [Rhodoferax sp.]MDO8449992.1 heme-binding protein [Rhodoferax sp.]